MYNWMLNKTAKRAVYCFNFFTLMAIGLANIDRIVVVTEYQSRIATAGFGWSVFGAMLSFMVAAVEWPARKLTPDNHPYSDLDDVY